MIEVSIENSFDSWRAAARTLVSQKVSPENVLWCPPGQDSLFTRMDEAVVRGPVTTVSPEFVELAEAIACFDSWEKWSLLYRLLFRRVHENRYLLERESDADVLLARRMEKAVNKDVHKFHAFVRFRKVECDGTELFVAWHEPHHFTVERAAPFFSRRFGSMKFSILTPKGCVHWDLESLKFSPGVDRISAAGDDTEDFWLTYYKAIFNPFRLKISAMKKEMPVRHWGTLPEAALIKELIRGVDGDRVPVSPPNYQPADE